MPDTAKKWILAVAIAIVFNLFVNFGLATFFDSPNYEDYCEVERVRPAFPAADNCTAISIPSDLQDSCIEQKGYVAYRYDALGCPSEAYCETCSVQFDTERKTYDNIVSLVWIIVGASALLFGVITRKNDTVGRGLGLAGIIALLIGTFRNFDDLNNVVRFILMGIILAILIWVAYKKLK